MHNKRIWLLRISNYSSKSMQVQVGSYVSGYKKYLENELDSTVRDKLAKEFGFIGDEPVKILEAAKQEISSEKT